MLGLSCWFCAGALRTCCPWMHTSAEGLGGWPTASVVTMRASAVACAATPATVGDEAGAHWPGILLLFFFGSGLVEFKPEPRRGVVPLSYGLGACLAQSTEKKERRHCDCARVEVHEKTTHRPNPADPLETARWISNARSTYFSKPLQPRSAKAVRTTGVRSRTDLVAGLQPSGGARTCIRYCDS